MRGPHPIETLEHTIDMLERVATGVKIPQKQIWATRKAIKKIVKKYYRWVETNKKNNANPKE